MQRHARRLAKGKGKALLIINPTSGPNNDSILRVKEIVERLTAHGVKTKVRVKLRKKQARKLAKRAAKNGCHLVIAAGGDGTVAPIAEGLVGTKTVLGIVPLGTYNNVATSLGIPTDLDAAIALIASGLVSQVDVGRVTATAGNRSRIFLEMAMAGVTAAMMPVGQQLKQGKLNGIGEILPAALQMTPTETVIQLDKKGPALESQTLLVEVANGPRSGPGIITAPDARVDDGELDVAIYHEHTQAAIAARFVALKTGLLGEDQNIERHRAKRIEVRSANPLPVVADSKVVGHTPARFEILPGALLVAAGVGIGLEEKPDPAVVAVATEPAPLPKEETDHAEAAAVALAAPPGAPARPGPLAVVAEVASEVIEKVARVGRNSD